MTWRTHVAVGSNAIWLTGLFGKVDESILILLPVAVIASLLPDIDATAAKIHFVGGGVLGIFKGSFHGKYFHHRGLMHSLFITIIFFIILWIFFRNSFPFLPYIFSLSYFSHPIIDGLNTGVGYLYPFNHKTYTLVPKFFRSRVGSKIDGLLMFVGLLGILLFFLTFAHQFFPWQPMGPI